MGTWFVQGCMQVTRKIGVMRAQSKDSQSADPGWSLSLALSSFWLRLTKKKSINSDLNQVGDDFPVIVLGLYAKNSFSLSSSLHLFYLAQTHIGLLYYFFSLTRAVWQSPGLLLPAVPLQPKPPAPWCPPPPPPPQPLVSTMAAKSASLHC